MMHDFITTNLAVQEMARETRKHQFGNLDSDELYKNEMWDSLDSAPGFKALFSSIVSWVSRRKRASSESRKVSAKVEAQSTQCAPQG